MTGPIRGNGTEVQAAVTTDGNRVGGEVQGTRTQRTDSGSVWQAGGRANASANSSSFEYGGSVFGGYQTAENESGTSFYVRGQASVSQNRETSSRYSSDEVSQAYNQGRQGAEETNAWMERDRRDILEITPGNRDFLRERADEMEAKLNDGQHENLRDIEVHNKTMIFGYVHECVPNGKEKVSAFEHTQGEIAQMRAMADEMQETLDYLNSEEGQQAAEAQNAQRLANVEQRREEMQNAQNIHTTTNGAVDFAAGVEQRLTERTAAYLEVQGGVGFTHENNSNTENNNFTARSNANFRVGAEAGVNITPNEDITINPHVAYQANFDNNGYNGSEIIAGVNTDVKVVKTEQTSFSLTGGADVRVNPQTGKATPEVFLGGKIQFK
jgi:hypothetical protein